MKLNTNFMGLNLENPLIISAGPWCSDPNQILNLFEHGAGAIVTETIATEVRKNIRPWIRAYSKGYGNVRLYSDHGLEKWMKFIRQIKESSYSKPVIASILAHSPSEMSYMASCVQKSGADAIELGISSPHGEGIAVMGSDPEYLYHTVKSVCKEVDIPIMVKLSAHTNNVSQLARAAQQGGANALSGIDSVRAILGVNLESRSPFLGTYGGYSGPPIKPVGLATVAMMAQSVGLDICGIGGIQSGKDALEYMMLGASAFQIGTGILSCGVEIISSVLSEIEIWLQEHDETVISVVGTALNDIKALDEMEGLPYYVRLVSKCAYLDCNKCVSSCLVNAISKEGTSVYINDNLCNGCGNCVSTCPNKNLEMVW